MCVEVGAILDAADVRLGSGGPAWRTLAADRPRASSLSALASRVLPPARPESMARAWAQGLADIALAMRASFPENLYWDLDYLAASLWRAGAGHDSAGHDAAGHDAAAGAVEIASLAALMVEVQRVFGRRTPIAFRYVHDFSYGFDWAKWVARDPGGRAEIDPFSATFITAMLDRGHELHAVIESGEDPKYPPLEGDGARNPFQFSREPEAEARLLSHLAAAELVPVKAWRVDASPRWDRPYARLRREAALSLGL